MAMGVQLARGVSRVRGRLESRSAEMLAHECELHEAQGHADGRQRETHPPAVTLCDFRHEVRADERARVDSHVEDGEARITPRAALRVESRDDGADVGLQQAHAYNNDHESAEEQLRLPEDQAGVADHDEDAAPPHRSLCTDDAIRDVAADKGQ
jgi:hypothetical protein